MREKDQSADTGICRDFYALLALMHPTNYRHTGTLLREMAAGEIVSDLRVQLANGYRAEHLPRERALVERAEIITTQRGHRIAWVDARGIEGPCNVAKRVIEQYGVDLVATVIPHAVLFGADGIDRGINLQPLHGTDEQDGVRLEVVEHRSPVRIQPQGPSISDDAFYRAVRNYIQRVV